VTPKGQRAIADRGEFRGLAHQPGAARELVDRHRVPHPMRHADDVMVVEVGADAGQVVQHRHADRLQMRRRADAGNLQQMRRVDRAAAEDHLARRGELAVGAALAERDAGAAFAVEQQLGRDRVGLDLEIAAPARLAQKGLRGRAAPAAAPRHLRIGDAFLLLAVVGRG
jgi:hypothetical protein